MLRFDGSGSRTPHPAQDVVDTRTPCAFSAYFGSPHLYVGSWATRNGPHPLRFLASRTSNGLLSSADLPPQLGRHPTARTSVAGSRGVLLSRRFPLSRLAEPRQARHLLSDFIRWSSCARAVTEIVSPATIMGPGSSHNHGATPVTAEPAAAMITLPARKRQSGLREGGRGFCRLR